MSKPNLIHDTKRALVYAYGKQGKITVSKRLLEEKADELDLVEAFDNGDILVENDPDAGLFLDMAGRKIDAEALKAIDEILD